MAGTLAVKCADRGAYTSYKLVRVREGADLSAYIQRHREQDVRIILPTTSPPCMEDLEEEITNSVCEATDGCSVEPDGTCEHGHPSWLLALGYI